MHIKTSSQSRHGRGGLLQRRVNRRFNDNRVHRQIIREIDMNHGQPVIRIVLPEPLEFLAVIRYAIFLQRFGHVEEDPEAFPNIGFPVAIDCLSVAFLDAVDCFLTAYLRAAGRG